MIGFVAHVIVALVLAGFVVRSELRHSRRKRALDATVSSARIRVTEARARHMTLPGAQPTRELSTLPSGQV